MLPPKKLEQVVWRKSSHSGSQGGSQCVELAVFPVGTKVVAVRDSTNPDGPWLAMRREAWGALLVQLKGSGSECPSYRDSRVRQDGPAWPLGRRAASQYPAFSGWHDSRKASIRVASRSR